MLSKILDACKNKRIYIYGDGEDGRLTRIFLHEQGILVSSFVVTGLPARKALMNLPVVSLNSVCTDAEETLFFVCMHKKWWGEAVDNLKNMGYMNFVVVDNDIRTSILKSVQFKDLFEDVERGRYINTLLYHRVESLKTVSSLIVNEKNFENQLLFIKKHYDILRANEKWDGVNKKSVVLTFDDGYVDFYSKAYPILKKYNVPATVFVATGNIDTKREFWWDRLERFLYDSSVLPHFCIMGKEYAPSHYKNKEDLLDEIHDQIIVMHYRDRDKAIDELKMQLELNEVARPCYRTMCSEEIRELSKDSLISIGAHTDSHILCDCEDVECQQIEIEKSKQILENLIGKEVNLFAYPNGNIGENTREILGNLGFTRAFTCIKGCVARDEKKFDIPRNPVLNWNRDENEKWFRGMWQTGKDV